MREKGFTGIVIVVLLVVILAAGSLYVVSQNKTKVSPSIIVPTLPQDIQTNTSIISPTPSLPPTQQASKKAPDSDTPASGICDQATGTTATITINADNSPMPRCVKVTGTQQLEIVNNTDHAIIAGLGIYSINVTATQKQTIGAPFESYLLPGVHNLLGANIWLQ